jgi:hypothetical protein
VVELLEKRNKYKNMRSIINTFNKIQKKQPELGSFCVLAEAVKDRKFIKDSIARMFTKLVPKEEYEKNERKNLIQYLHNLSNPFVDNELEAKNEL